MSDYMFKFNYWLLPLLFINLNTLAEYGYSERRYGRYIAMLRNKLLSKKLSYLITHLFNKKPNSKLANFYFNNHLLIKSKQTPPRLNWDLNRKYLYTYNDSTILKKKHGLLYVTFSKRNTFFNLTDSKSRTLNLVTVRREGFLGRRRTEYTSVFSTSRIIKQKFKAFKLDNIALVYKG